MLPGDDICHSCPCGLYGSYCMPDFLFCPAKSLLVSSCSASYPQDGTTLQHPYDMICRGRLYLLQTGISLPPLLDLLNDRSCTALQSCGNCQIPTIQSSRLSLIQL